MSNSVHVHSMSNPARPPKEQLSARQMTLLVAPDAYFYPQDAAAFDRRVKGSKDIKELQRRLEGLDMRVERTFVVPKEHTVDNAILAASKQKLAVAKTGKPVFRVRTSQGKEAVNAFYRNVPVVAPHPAFTQEVVAARIRDRFLVDAGTELTLGRLEQAYPRVGVRPARPITRSEAEEALRSCGLEAKDLPSSLRRGFPLVPDEGQEGISVNPRSDNGFPVLGQWRTEGAAQKVMGLARALRREFERVQDRPDGVWKMVRDLESSNPELMAFRGKAKADFYSTEKIESFRLRFYNALPRQLMLIMQMGTQPFERTSRTILTEGHSGIGLSLVRGGAQDLVDALQRQVDEDGVAFVHVGDDSWVVARVGEELVLFSLDCSNFDLTQHADTTREVHEALRERVALFDRVAADLWFSLMRERLVVVAGTLVRRWRHAGPSGSPLQSKVNDMLMDVLIRRLVRNDKFKAVVTDREELDRLIQDVGTGMGFRVRLEDHDVHVSRSLQAALADKPFLFVGYYFHVVAGQVTVYADVPRALAQLPYPNLKWMAEKGDVAVMEAFRVGSIVMNMGVPPACLQEAHAALVNVAVRHLEDALRLGRAEDADKLRWAVQENPFGADVEPSLRGLLRAVQRDPRLLWMDRPLTVAERIRRNLEIEEPSWADEADAEEEAEEIRLGLTPVLVRAAPMPKNFPKLEVSKVPTHPATSRNDGRPPPTVVWGPPKEPKLRMEEMRVSKKTRRRDGLLSREFQQALEDSYLEVEEDGYELWE